MTTRRARIDRYVRQATAPTASQVGLLADVATRQELYDAIILTDPIDRDDLVVREGFVDGDEAVAVVGPRRSARRRLVAVTAAAAVTAAVVMVTVIATNATRRPANHPGATASTARPAPSPTPGSSESLGTGVSNTSCAVRYNAVTLAERAFAFDGTVVAATAPPAGGGEPPDVAVTFHINRWYRGGTADEVTVAMFAAPGQSSEDGVAYQIGSRLLVTGEPRFGGSPLTDPVAWGCGFTRWYTPADARMWQDTFR